MISFYYKNTTINESFLAVDIKHMTANSSTISVDNQSLQVSDGMLLMEMFSTLLYKKQNTLIRYIDGVIDVVAYRDGDIQRRYAVDDIIGDFLPHEQDG